MQQTTLFFIGGVISPPITPMSCRQELRCEKQLIRPLATTRTICYALEFWEQCKHNFGPEEEALPSYWSSRILMHLATAPFLLSVTFLPFNLEVNRTWLVQKNRQEPPFDGFFAPYLEESEQSSLGCFKPTEDIYLISDEGHLEASIADLNTEVYAEIKTLLSYFLNDELYALIGVTYLNQQQEKTTRLWRKEMR